MLIFRKSMKINYVFLNRIVDFSMNTTLFFIIFLKLNINIIRKINLKNN